MGIIILLNYVFYNHFLIHHLPHRIYFAIFIRIISASNGRTSPLSSSRVGQRVGCHPIHHLPELSKHLGKFPYLCAVPTSRTIFFLPTYRRDKFTLVLVATFVIFAS